MNNLTIILCTYNGQEFISEQLKSIENQTRSPDNILIFDSGSKDNTEKKAKTFIKNTKIETKFFKIEHTGSVSKSFKKALQFSVKFNLVKKYIALCDQDDIWKNNKLEIFLKFLNSSNSKDNYCFFSDVEIINKDSALIKNSRYESSRFFKMPKTINSSILFANPATGMSMIFSRNIAKEYAYFKSEDLFMHDWTIILIGFFKYSEIRISSEKLVSYRQHKNNVLGTNSKRNFIENILYARKFIKNCFIQFNNFKQFNNEKRKIKFFSIKIIYDIFKSDFLTLRYRLILLILYLIFSTNYILKNISLIFSLLKRKKRNF